MASQLAAGGRWCLTTPRAAIPALLCAAALSSAVLSSAVVPTAIVGARLIDGTGTTPVEDSLVVVEGDRIRAAGPRALIPVPRDAAIVDAKSKVLMPGLVDVHCHINQPPDEMKRYWLAQLRWGVTTMRSAGNDKPETVPLFRQTRAGEFLAPRSYTSGQGFNVSGPLRRPHVQADDGGGSAIECPGPEGQKADFIKIWMTKPLFPPEVIAAIVDEGRKQGITVIAHVTDVASLHQLADLGVTGFLHNPINQPVTPDLIAYAKRKNLTFAPTLANIESRWFYYEHPDILNMPMLQAALYPRGRQMLADARERHRRCRRRTYAAQGADARTDLPVHQSDVRRRRAHRHRNRLRAEASQVTPFGHATHREMQMFVEAGMSPLAAIRAATLDAARVVTRTEDPENGSIRAGKIADLLLLDADPSVDIGNTIRISRVMRAGAWVP